VTDLWQGGFLPESLQWLRRFVTLSEGPAAPTGKPVFSPAVRSLFFAAMTRLSGYGDEEAKSFAVRSLYGQLYASRGLIGAWLADRGLRAETVPSSRRGGARKTARPARPVPVAGMAEDATLRQSLEEKGQTPIVVPSVEQTAEKTAASGPKSADSSDTKRYPRLTGDAPPAEAERFAGPTTVDAVLD